MRRKSSASGCSAAQIRRYASIGDKIRWLIKSATPSGDVKKKKGAVSKAVVVRPGETTPKPTVRTSVSDDNAVVLLNNQGEMRGTRIFRPRNRELRDQYMKIILSHPKYCNHKTISDMSGEITY